MTICTLCVEIDATYSDPPIRIKLLGLRSSQGHPQFKNGTVYRQVRPTRLDEIKNFHPEVQLGAVSGRPVTECEVCSASAYSHLNSRALAATQTAAIVPR